MAETVFGENYIKSTFKEFCENTNLCGFLAHRSVCQDYAVPPLAAWS